MCRFAWFSTILCNNCCEMDAPVNLQRGAEHLCSVLRFLQVGVYYCYSYYYDFCLLVIVDMDSSISEAITMKYFLAAFRGCQ